MWERKSAAHHAQPPLAHISKGFHMPPLRELMVLYQLAFYLDIYFIFAWRIGPMFLKAHLTIPYAYLNHPYQTSCRMMLWFILFCFPFLHNVFMYIYPICWVPLAKLQVWDLSYAGAAVLLLMPYKTKVRLSPYHCSSWQLHVKRCGAGTDDQGSRALRSRDKSYLALY